MTSGKAPHKAVMLLKIEVHEINKNGECSGKLVDPATLGEYGIKSKVILKVDGFDRNDCLTKLKKALDGIER